MRLIRAFSSKIYTRTGDNGTTFIRTSRLPKYAPIFRVLGDTDELSCALSVAREHVKVDKISSTLTDIQHRLQDINSLISTASTQNFVSSLPQLLNDKTEVLERDIDEMTDELDPLRNFIIPSGGPAATHLHFSRAICRRTERSLCEFLKNDANSSLGAAAEIYLNRLSDYLFTAARYCAKTEGYPETTYSSRKPK